MVRRLKIFFLSIWHFCLFLLRNLLISAAVVSIFMLAFPNQFQSAVSVFQPIPNWVLKRSLSLQQLHPVVGQHERMKADALAELGISGGFETMDSRRELRSGEEVERLREEVRELRRQVDFLSRYARGPSEEKQPTGWLQSLFCRQSTETAKF